MNPIPYPYNLWCSLENPQYEMSTHFCNVAKNTASDRNCIGSPYTSGPEKPSKKLLMFLNACPVSLISVSRRVLFTAETCPLKPILPLVRLRFLAPAWVPSRLRFRVCTGFDRQTRPRTGKRRRGTHNTENGHIRYTFWGYTRSPQSLTACYIVCFAKGTKVKQK